MLIKSPKSWEIKENEVTPKGMYLSRRNFMRAASAVAGSSLLAACRPARPDTQSAAAPQAVAPSTGNEAAALDATTRATADELGSALTDFQDIISYNNYYEFTVDKQRVKDISTEFVTNPWQIEVSGMVRNPGTYDLSKLRSQVQEEERIYRLRCVEAWSMVVPWNGFTLSQLLDIVEPTSDAKYVKFQTLYDPDQFPGQKAVFSPYEWPYTEGLRLDEAYNELTMMATGIYGEELLPQNGAPVRLVVPWKYGFKSIKSIVSIELTDEQPISLWMAANSREYGFYSNVNPTVPHPRWSQATERRIGEFGRRETLMFNGYEEQVAGLYEGMDLAEFF